MGSLKLPTAGPVYVDAVIVIYGVERHPQFVSILDPLWKASASGNCQIITSALSLLECLVRPLKTRDAQVVADYENALTRSEFKLIEVSLDVLRTAAEVRAAQGLKTPDAVHAASGLRSGCAMFLTNDRAFARVPNLPVVILDEILASP